MLRIWARTTKDGKITRSYIYESIDNFNEETIRKHIEKICHEIDIPTPLILKIHITNYVEQKYLKVVSKLESDENQHSVTKYKTKYANDDTNLHHILLLYEAG